MKHILVCTLLLSCLICVGQGKDRFKKGDGTQEEPVEQQKEEPTPKTKEAKKDANFWDKVVFGGTAGASFGNNTFILIAPTMGYQFTKKYVAGAGFLYQYQSLSLFNAQTGQIERGAYTSSTYGPLVYNYFNLLPMVYVGAQFEYLNFDNPILDINGRWRGEVENVWAPVLFLELGYSQQIGSKGAIRLGARYNILHDPNRSPYASPFYPAIGFFF